MNIMQVRYAAAVAQLLSFSNAAEELHMTQSGISQQILRLESELGFPLFVREKRGVSLTARGARFIEAARPVLADFDNLCALADSLRLRVDEYTVTVGTSTIYRPEQADAVAAFTQRHPEVHLRVVDAWEGEMAEQLRRGELDVGLFGVDNNYDDLTDCLVIPIRSERIMAVLSSEHPLARSGKLPVERLMGEKLIFAAPQTGTRRMIREALNRRGLELPDSIFIQSLDTRLHYVARGMGITFSMDATLPSPLRQDVTALPLEPLMLRTYVVAVSPKMRREHPALVKLLEKFIVEMREK